MVHKSRLNFGRVNLWKLLKLWSLKFGGAGGVRTRGLLDAIEARSQLRYGPTRTNDLRGETETRSRLRYGRTVEPRVPYL